MVFVALGALGAGLAHPPLCVPVVVVGTVLLVGSHQLIPFRAGSWAGSIGIAIAVLALWIAPNLLWPAYRSHWVFDNVLVGSARSSVPPDVRSDLIFVALRVFGSVGLVPVLEELFWRGWLMGWERPSSQTIGPSTTTLVSRRSRQATPTQRAKRR
jgi:CAAX protease family protein